MGGYLTDLQAEFRGPRSLVVWAGLTFALSVGGPLGTLHTCTFEHRFLFWSVVVIGMIILTAMVSALQVRFSRRPQRQRDLVLVAGTVALLLTVPIRAVAAGATEMSVQIVSSRATETLAFLFLTTLALALFRQMNMPAVVPTAVAVETPVDQPRVIDRLEPALRGSLLSLTGRDHYVDVRTSAGTGSILMRFSDAMAEVAPVEGAQIHRSHWVAWSAIDSVERDGAKISVVVAGQRLPVSRSFRGALAERGLL